MHRRTFLTHSTAALLLGCRQAEPADTGPACEDLLAGGTFVGIVDFVGEDDLAVGERQGEGLDGRLAYDHAELDVDALVTPTDAFFIRTMAPASLPAAAEWTVTFDDLGEPGLSAALIRDQAVDQGTVLLECSENGSNRGFGRISAATWTGVALADLLDNGHYVRTVEM